MDLPQIRKKIDALDDRILSLLNERARASEQVGRLKRENGQGIYAPHREKEILSRLKALNKGPLTPEAIDAIYREIMSFSISLEKRVTIAYLGPAVTYTHQAAQKKFGSSVDYAPCSTISDVFAEVEKEACDYGVVPIENSTEGAVNHTLDLFIDSPLKIYAEVFLSIHHALMTKGQALKEVTQVYSKDQVFGQCRQWIEKHLRDARLVETQSTAEAAQIVANDGSGAGLACIASKIAADVYGLDVLAARIEDHAENTTRFLVISRQEARPTRGDKTSIVFEIKDRAGALHDILVPFKKARINLTKIESRPSKKRAWSYYFFVDFEGHHEDARVRRALETLGGHCSFLKVLGSYPKADG